MARTSATAKLQKLVKRFEPSIRRAFTQSIRNITDNVVLEDMIRAIEDGDIARATRLLGLDESAFRPLMTEIERAFEVGGVTTGETFPKRLPTPGGRTVFRFDVRNSRAEATLRDHSSKLVREITEETRAVVRTTIQKGMVDGRNPRSTALDLVGRIDKKTGKRYGGVIGLTGNQENWVSSFKRDLETLDPAYFKKGLRNKTFDRIVKKAIKDGQPISKEKIDDMVSHYRNSVLRYRAEVIGRTEAIAALNKSEHEAINQAVDRGAISPSQVRRVWDSAGNDGRTRDSHLAMEGQTVGLNEPFTFPSGSQAMFPGDTSLGAPGKETIQCRCVARTVIDWLAKARDVMTEKERAALAALSDDELFGGR